MYLFNIELQINEQHYQSLKDVQIWSDEKTEYKYNKIRQLREGFKMCFQRNVTHDQEDIEFLQQMYLENQSRSKTSTNMEMLSEGILDLIKIELFLICLDKLDSMLIEMNDLNKIYQQKLSKYNKLEKSHNISAYQ